MIPDKVKIGGIVYDVKFVDCVDKTDLHVDGTIVYSSQEILLKKNPGKDYTNMVFLHEVVHGIFNSCSLEQDENIVKRLAEALYQVLKDNDIRFGQEGAAYE